jgi:DNA-binding NarL/FixJ family response regulator
LQKADALHPEVVLVNISLGSQSGFELTSRLVENFPDLRSRVVRDQEDYADVIATSPAAGSCRRTDCTRGRSATY